MTHQSVTGGRMTPDAQSAVNAIRALPATHANLTELCAAVAAFAAGIECDGIDAVSEHLDAASDACDDCFMASPEVRAERWAA